jgi:hypothetical protein
MEIKISAETLINLCRLRNVTSSKTSLPALIFGDIDLQAFVNTVKNFRVLLLLAQLHICCLIKNCVAVSWSFGSYRSSIIFGLRKTHIKITEFFHSKMYSSDILNLYIMISGSPDYLTKYK